MKKYRIWSKKKNKFIQGSTDTSESSSWCKFWWDNIKDRELNGKKISETHRLEAIDEDEEWDHDE